MRRPVALAAAAALFFLLLAPSEAHASQTAAPAATLDEQMQSILQGIDLSAWESALQTVPGAGETKALVLRLARGEAVLSADGLLRLALSALLREAAATLPVLLRLMALALVAGVLQQMRGALAKEGVSRVAQMTCMLLCVVPLAGDFAGLVAGGRDAIVRMGAFTQRAMPVLLTLLAAVGGHAGAAVAQPAVLAATSIVSTVVQGGVLPLTLFSAALCVVSALSSGLPLDRLRTLIASACNWALGVSFTVFVAVLAVQGVAASSFDGVSLRTAKYAVDNFVPVVGGLFADAMDVFVGCSLLIKNGLGVSALMAVVAYCALPVLRILATLLCYRLAGALLQPVADEKLVACLGDLSSVLTTLLVAVLSAAAMFLVLIGMTASFSGLTAALR